MAITVDVSAITPSADGKLYEQYPSGDAPVGITSITSLGSDRYRIDGAGFGSKPNGQKTFATWDSDLGLSGFDPAYSRQTAWDNSPNGEISVAEVSAGATQSSRKDLSDEGAALGFMTLTTEPEKFLMYRHRYDDFDVAQDQIRRTRINSLVGSIVTAGQTVTGSSSGATGIVQSVDDEGGGNYTIYYEPVGGTINDDPLIAFTSGEQQTWSGGSATNDEGQGMLYGFNNKLFRAWDKRGQSGQHNVYFSESGESIASGNNGRRTTTVEGITTSPTLVDNTSVARQQQTKEQWINDMFFVKNSSAPDAADGVTAWWKESVTAFTNETDRVTQGSSPLDGRLTELVQHQVSNRCQPNSYAYYSMIVFEDSWHFVTAWNSARTKFMLLPVESWTDTEIIVKDYGREVWSELDIHVDSLVATFTGAKP